MLFYNSFKAQFKKPGKGQEHSSVVQWWLSIHEALGSNPSRKGEKKDSGAGKSQRCFKLKDQFLKLEICNLHRGMLLLLPLRPNPQDSWSLLLLASPHFLLCTVNFTGIFRVLVRVLLFIKLLSMLPTFFNLFWEFTKRFLLFLIMGYVYRSACAEDDGGSELPGAAITDSWESPQFRRKNSVCS